MAYNARVLLDSVSPAGVRLTTLEVTFPRFVLAEFNTHRAFCLDSDTRLYFDLPGRLKRSGTGRFTMTVREFYEKWHGGAAPRINRGRTRTFAGVDSEREYTAKELASAAGYADYTGIDLLTRRVRMPRSTRPGVPYRILGADFIAWMKTTGVNRQPLRDRLKAMRLRSCNETTGEIYHTNVRDVTYSGKRPVFRLTLKNGQQILASKDHRFLTTDGWQRLEDAVGLVLSPGNIATWKRAAQFAVNGIAAYRDPQWLAGLRDAGLSAAGIAKHAGVTIDQVKYQFRKHGLRETNPEAVCRLSHLTEPWNKGRRYCNVKTRGRPGKARVRRCMVRHFVPMAAVEYVGIRDTYDVAVEGPYENFIADGFVVHNSRNSASSRAIPTAKLLERLETDPAIPLEWGRNKAGMSATEVLAGEEADEARRVWLAARDGAVAQARRLVDLNVHKQELNRLLEPFLWHTVIVTATEWENFFELRCAPTAQPEIRQAAIKMREAIAQSRPNSVGLRGWHTPLVQDDENALDCETRRRVSAARCARVSYLTHDGKREISRDLELFERLRVQRHLSPFEHVATPSGDSAFHANFRGWIQFRREIENSTPPG